MLRVAARSASTWVAYNVASRPTSARSASYWEPGVGSVMHGAAPLPVPLVLDGAAKARTPQQGTGDRKNIGGTPCDGTPATATVRAWYDSHRDRLRGAVEEVCSSAARPARTGLEGPRRRPGSA